ncbi:MAG: CoA-binding protein [Dehalococcoidales bacterium]|nr:CoA-binding protein [Dehalococcoidales bacterium]
MKVDFAKLERAFYPKSVAVVGDKSINNYIWLRGQSHFKGKLYSVQVDPKELDGIKALGVPNYASLLDIPEPIDFVIVAVPRPVAQRILEDCIKKDVAAAHFFTSGFSETDTEDGKLAEKRLVERALEANFHLIGPNCMGIYSPSVGVCQTARQQTGFSGNVGFIAQSGTHAITFSEEAYTHCLEINKSVSFGNGRVLDASDFLEYFAQDDSIKAIGMYMEGTRNGQRFLRTLKEVTAKKPVVIWKGGRTEEGGRAIASHTGSLAVPQAIWESAIKQCGAIRVTSIEELTDTINAILLMKPVFGNRVGIAGGSGGQSVAIADVFAENGLKVPTLTKESYDNLASFFVLIGSSYRNPIDPSVNRKEMTRIMDILEKDANIDSLVLMTSVSSQMRAAEQIEKDIDMLVDLRKRSRKPIALVLGYCSPEAAQETKTLALRLRDVGVPTFVSVERGAKALRNAHEYYLLKSGKN